MALSSAQSELILLRRDKRRIFAVGSEERTLNLGGKWSRQRITFPPRSYLTISKDQGRVMSRLKALYRSWGIPCAGRQVYTPRHRESSIVMWMDNCNVPKSHNRSAV